MDSQIIVLTLQIILTIANIAQAVIMNYQSKQTQSNGRKIDRLINR